MAKTCPSCGYRPIGPFTDNCPICAEPVRNVRSDGAGSAWSGSFGQVARWVLGGAALLLLGVAGCCGMGMWRMGAAIEDVKKQMDQARAAVEADRKARTVTVAAADLLQEFHDDAGAADQKYKGKYLVLSGVVERTGKGAGGAPFVILHAGDEQALLKIECFFDLADEDEDIRNQQLGKGQAVTVRGEYSGRVSHLQVRGCILAK